jgi:serine/threonine protein kinase
VARAPRGPGHCRSPDALTRGGLGLHSRTAVPHRVGDYELVRRIGSGGMAEVWMGRRDLVGGASKSVAIKFIAASMAGNDRHRKMFLDEARLSMLLSHSNVVQVFDAGQDGERMYMVMEWVDGLNLSQISQLARASGQALSMSLVGYVIGEVLQGLSYAHTLRHEGRQLGIIHRDISPHNVLVSLSGEVKLADFGVARLSTEETSGVHIKGKLRYMAPEHLAGRTKSPKVDLFGAGAILHELLAGDRFRAEADEVALYHQILGGVTPALDRPDVPRELLELRLALLEPDENRRVPSADDALAMLEAWPGYRNAKGELSRMCRAFMGVDAPRSGLHVRPERSGVSPLADTEAPTAPTHTAAHGSREPTAPHGEGRTPVPGGEVSTLIGVPPRRSVWPWVAGIAGAMVLATASAFGVAKLVQSKRADATVASAPVGEASDAPPQTPDPVPTPAVATAPVRSAGPDLAAVTPTPEATPTVSPPVEPEPTSPVEPALAAATPPKPGVKSPKAGKPAAKPDEPKKPTPATPAAKLDVVFRVSAPLRYAWVRIDGASVFAVEPRATRSISAGSHTIDWRAEEANPWVSGGRFEFVAGTKPTIRLGSKGPSLE